ncbi:hypothetical protein JCM3774_003742 [Rhodotorula dairenensis]
MQEYMPQAYGGPQAGAGYGLRATTSAASLPPGPRPAPPPGPNGGTVAGAGRRTASGQNGRRISRAVDAGPYDDEFHQTGGGAAEWARGGSASAYYQDDLHRRVPPPSTTSFAPVPGLARPHVAAVHVKSEVRDGRATAVSSHPAPTASAADYDAYANLSPQTPHRHAQQQHPQVPPPGAGPAQAYSRSVPNAQSFVSPSGPPHYTPSEPPANLVPTTNPDRSPSAVRLPTPSVEGLMAHFARTDELHRVRSRCAQVDEALQRGVYPPEDSRAGRPYPVEEQIHLERQIQQCRDREIAIIEDCEIFFRAHGGQAHVLRCAEQYLQHRQQVHARNFEAARYAASQAPPPVQQAGATHVRRPQPLHIDTHPSEVPPHAGPSSAAPHRQQRRQPPLSRNQSYTYHAYDAQPHSAPPAQQHFHPSSTSVPRPLPPSEGPTVRTPQQSFHQIQRASSTLTLRQQHQHQQQQQQQQQHEQQQQHVQYFHQQSATRVTRDSAEGNAGRSALEQSRFQTGSYADLDLSAFGITQMSSPVRTQHPTSAATTYPTDIPEALHAQLNAARRHQAQQQQKQVRQVQSLNSMGPRQVVVGDAGNDSASSREQPDPSPRLPPPLQQWGPPPSPQSTRAPQTRSPRHPTQLLAEGGGLAELQAQIAPSRFFGMLGQVLSRRNEGPLPERCFVGSFQVDLFQLSQIVIGRCAGYVKVDQDNAWPQVAAMLLPSSVAAPETMRVPPQLRDLYMQYVAPYEDDWSSEMLRRRNQQLKESNSSSAAPPQPAQSSARPVAALPSKPRSRPPSRLGGPVQFAPISTPATHAPIAVDRANHAPGSTPSEYASQGGGSSSAAHSPTSPRSRASTISTASSMFASAFGGFTLGPTTALATTDSSLSSASASELPSATLPQQALLTPAEELSLAEILAQVDAHQQAMSTQGGPPSTTPLEPPASLPALPTQSPQVPPSPGAAAVAAAAAAGHFSPFSPAETTTTMGPQQRKSADSLLQVESRPVLQRAISDSSVTQAGDDPATRITKRTRDAGTSRERVGDEERRKRESTGQFSPRKPQSTGQCSAESTPDLVPSGSRRPGTASTGTGSIISPLVMTTALPDVSPNLASTSLPRKLAEARTPDGGSLAIPSAGAGDIAVSTPSPSTLGAVSDFDLLSLTTPITTEFPADAAVLPPPLPTTSYSPVAESASAAQWESYDLFAIENGLNLTAQGDPAALARAQDGDGKESNLATLQGDYSIDFDSYKPMTSPELNRSLERFRSGSSGAGGGGVPAGPGDPNGDEYWHPSSLLDFEFAADFAT